MVARRVTGGSFDICKSNSNGCQKKLSGVSFALPSGADVRCSAVTSSCAGMLPVVGTFAHLRLQIVFYPDGFDQVELLFQPVDMFF